MINLRDAYTIVNDSLYEKPFLLYVGVGGDVNVIMDDGNEIMFKNVRSGTFMPVFVRGVKSSDTSASGLLASKTSYYKDLTTEYLTLFESGLFEPGLFD